MSQSTTMLRRWLRLVYYAIAGLLGFALIAIVALLIVLSTSWGKEQLRTIVNAHLRVALVGGGSIGRIEGSVLGDLVVRNIVINDASGQAAIVIAQARIEARLWPLLDKFVHIDQLEISGMQVKARQDREGQINLATLTAKGEGRPMTVRVRIDEITLADSSIALAMADGSTETLESLEIGPSSLAFSKSGLELVVGPTSARHRERQVELGLEGSLSKRDGRMAFRDIQASLAGAKLDLQSARIENSQLHEVRAAIAIPARSVQALAGLPWLADTTLHFQSDGPELEIRGALAGAALTGHATPDLRHGQIELVLDLGGVDLGALWAGLPSSALDLSLRGGYGPTASHATIASRGTVAGKDVEAASMSLSLRGKQLKARAEARAAGSSVVAGADIELGKSTTIRSSTLELASDDLRQLVSPWLELRGDLRAKLSAQGSIDSIAVRGSVAADRLEAFGFHARDLKVYPDLQRRGDRAVGSVNASVSSLARAGTRLRALRLKARSEDGRLAVVDVSGTGRGVAVNLNAALRLKSESLGIELARARAQYKDLKIRSASGRGSWTFSGPRSGRLELDDLQLRSNAGRLALSGDLRRSGRAGSSIEFDAQEIDLSRLSRVAELENQIVGMLSMKASIDTRRGQRADLSLHAEGIAGGGFPVTNGDLSLRLRGRDLIAILGAEMVDAAKLQLRTKVRTPRKLFDLARWMSLDRSALVSLDAHAEVSDAARFSHLHPELPLAGRFELQATQEEGQAQAAVDLRGNGLIGRRLDEPARVWVHLDLEGARIAASGEISLGARASAIFRASLRLGGPWFVSHSYQRLALGAIERASASTSEVEVDWLLEHFAPKIAKTGALAQASFEYAPKSKSYELAATVSLPRGGPLRRLIAQEVTLGATLHEHHGEAGIVARDVVRTRVEGRGDFDLGWRDLLAGNRDLRAVAARASLAITELPLRSVRDVLQSVPVPIDAALSGTLNGTASFSGTIRAPQFSAHATMDVFAIAGVAIASLVADGDLRGGSIAVKASAAQVDGGSMRISAKTDFSTVDSAPVSAQIDATRFDLAFVSAFLPDRDISGLLSAKLRVTGTRTRPSVRGSATLSKGSFNPGTPFYAIKNAEIQADLGADKMLVRAKLQSGNGKANIRGTIDLDGNAPGALQVSISTQALPIDAGTLLLRLDSVISVSGREQGDTWQLLATVEKATVDLPGVLARKLHPVELPRDLILSDSIKIEKRDAMISSVPTALKIAIRTKNRILVKGGGVNALVGASLDVSLDQELRVNGSVRVEQGRIEILGRRYDIRSAQAAFSGDLDPALQVELAHEFEALTLFIDVTGLASKPVVSFRSDPARYDTAELLAFVLGASPDDTTTESRSPAEQATGVAGSLVAGVLSGVVANVAPIDVLRIDTDDSSAERVALGKWLTERLLIAYRHRFTADPNVNVDELVFEYRFLERWLLEGYIGQVVLGADVIWIRRY